MNRLVWLMTLFAFVLVSGAAAQTCFTAVNVPEANQNYWKAITYTELVDGDYSNYLSRDNVPSSSLSLGSGYQYQMRLDKNCFNGYLLSNTDVSGVTSGDINIQQRDDDLYTSNFVNNKLYTVSILEDESISTKLVSQVSTGVIDGTDYLALPNSFQEANKHPKYTELLNSGLCQDNLKITDQLEDIRIALWDELEPTNQALTCSKTNAIDCALEQGKADSKLYAASAMALARSCGVPARVAHGVGQGSFDGVDISFAESKKHYWLEFYDEGWHNFEVVEAGPGSPDNFEYNCMDGIDNDGNGQTDCNDLYCSTDRACTATVTTSSFDNQYSTDLSSLPNIVSVDNLTVGNEFGSVSWLEKGLDLRDVTLEEAISISKNRLNINNVVSDFNQPAVASINEQGDYLRIQRNGQTCSDCELLSDEGRYSFTIPGSGTYSIQFANTTSTNTTEPTTTTNSPTNSDGLVERAINQVTSSWNRLTQTGKATVVVLGIIVLWLWWRRRRRRRYAFNR